MNASKKRTKFFLTEKVCSRTAVTYEMRSNHLGVYRQNLKYCTSVTKRCTLLQRECFGVLCGSERCEQTFHLCLGYRSQRFWQCIVGVDKYGIICVTDTEAPLHLDSCGGYGVLLHWPSVSAGLHEHHLRR